MIRPDRETFHTLDGRGGVRDEEGDIGGFHSEECSASFTQDWMRRLNFISISTGTASFLAVLL